jgi:hypothetical protein
MTLKNVAIDKNYKKDGNSLEISQERRSFLKSFAKLCVPTVAILGLSERLFSDDKKISNSFNERENRRSASCGVASCEGKCSGCDGCKGCSGCQGFGEKSSPGSIESCSYEIK